jgi:Trm5-related predicted tRNA methylase
VDPISYVIKSAASHARCKDIVLPRWNIATQCYCAYPSIRECAAPRNLPVNPVQIEKEDMLDLGLRRSIYSKAQVEEFLKFQDSQGPREPT